MLRSESAASSKIENLTASARAIAEAELHGRAGHDATLMVANQKAMSAAIALAERLDTDAILAMHAELLHASRPEIAGRWREDNGSNQGTAWRAFGFNDAAWKSGRAPLGYGDPVATVVSFGSRSSRKHITTYFRQAFTAPSAFSSMSLRLRRDDGAVVYVNGTEVARSNMPTGTISSTTLASATVDGSNETAWFTFPVSTELFAGTNANVVAVEIHQRSRSSSDIVFDAELTGSGTAGALPSR